MKKIELRENRTANALSLNAGIVIGLLPRRSVATVIKEAVVGRQLTAPLCRTRFSDFTSVMNLFGWLADRPAAGSAKPLGVT